jgi:hypothetical protein
MYKAFLIGENTKTQNKCCFLQILGRRIETIMNSNDNVEYKNVGIFIVLQLPMLWMVVVEIKSLEKFFKFFFFSFSSMFHESEN